MRDNCSIHHLKLPLIKQPITFSYQHLNFDPNKKKFCLELKTICIQLIQEQLSFPSLTIESDLSNRKVIGSNQNAFRIAKTNQSRKDTNSKCAHLAPLRPNSRCGLKSVTPNRRIAAIGAISATIAEKTVTIKNDDNV